MASPDHGVGQDRDELLRASLLRLVSYFTQRVEGDEMMREQLIFLGYMWGVRPKDLASAAHVSPNRVHQVVKKLKDMPPPEPDNEEELLAQVEQLIRRRRVG